MSPSTPRSLGRAFSRRLTNTAPVKRLSLADVASERTLPFALSSPRSLEACARHGIVVEDLQHHPRESFFTPEVPEEIAALRFEHAERRRRERLEQVRQEHAHICAHENFVPHRAERMPLALDASQLRDFARTASEERGMADSLREIDALKRQQREEVGRTSPPPYKPDAHLSPRPV
jgi:hypothetical protein